MNILQDNHIYKNINRLIDINYGTTRGMIRVTLAQIEFILDRLDTYIVPDVKKVNRLVFVCLGNINRSAFAEKVAKSLGANTCSIGLVTTTGQPAFHKAVTTSFHFGIDLSQHMATDIKDYCYQLGDLLLTMEIRHAHRLVAFGFPKQSIALLGHWASPLRIHLHDPHTLSDAYFFTCFTLINSAVSGLIKEMREAHSPCICQ
jgi:protein-tyrosine phosphatase